MMFPRSSPSSTSRCTYGLSLSATAAAPALAAFFFAAIELPRLACGCRREHTPTTTTPSARCRRRRLERELEDLLDVLDETELDVLAQVLGEILAVALVELRGDDEAHARALGRERLLLEPADRQHLARQRVLAGHRDVVAHRAARHQRAQRGGDRDARARAVLGDRTRRHVH